MENAQILKKIEAVENSLKNNAKILVDTNKVQTIVTEAAGVTPIPREEIKPDSTRQDQ